MKIYVLIEYCGLGSFDIIGAYSTLEKAEEAKAKDWNVWRDGSRTISEVELDENF